MFAELISFFYAHLTGYVIRSYGLHAHAQYACVLFPFIVLINSVYDIFLQIAVKELVIIQMINAVCKNIKYRRRLHIPHKPSYQCLHRALFSLFSKKSLMYFLIRSYRVSWNIFIWMSYSCGSQAAHAPASRKFFAALIAKTVILLDFLKQQY